MAHNVGWIQVNSSLFTQIAQKARSSFAPQENVLWLPRRPFQATVRSIITTWTRGTYLGHQLQQTMSQYDQTVLERFAEGTLSRESVEELAISTTHTAVGDFTLHASGKLFISLTNGKYPTTIKMYAYYRGPDKPIVFRVKPSQQEKWERTTEGWNKSTHDTFDAGVEKAGVVYRLYRQVLDKCAEYQYSKTVD